VQETQQLTKDWPKVKLEAVLSRSAETTELKADVEYREITVRLWGKGVLERSRVIGAEIAGGRRFTARAGQFIASRIDARNGAMGIVPDSLDGAVVTNDFPLFNLNVDRLLPSYIGWLCRTNSFVELCQGASEGTTNRVRLQESSFLALGIPIPPLAEQQRIVARIEELAAQINEARTLNRKSTEEAAALHANLLRAIMLNCESDEIKLETVCSEIIDNLHSNPHYSDSGVACVRSPDVGRGVLNLEMALRTDEEEFVRRTVRGRPQTDDVVFVREGGGTGKCALVLSGQRFSLGQRVMILRPKKQIIDPRFFLYQLLSPLVQEEQIGQLSKGSAAPHLNIGALRRFRFRLPQLSVQRLIVAKLNALQAEMDSLKHIQAETSAELDALLPAILDRAFKGELL
jgi:type I restriction enzyme S subunit